MNKKKTEDAISRIIALINLKRPLVTICADGGSRIGMGHITRCLALAEMVRENFEIRFYSTLEGYQFLKKLGYESILPEDPGITMDTFLNSSPIQQSDIIVLDGYNFKTDAQQKIKDEGKKLVVIDDLHAWHHVADVIINHGGNITDSLYSAESYCTLCLGFEYALLRRPFLNIPKRNPRSLNLSSILLTMGASDTNDNTSKFLNTLLDDISEIQIHVLTGSVNPNLNKLKKHSELNTRFKLHVDVDAAAVSDLMQECGLVFCPASTISLEACASGNAVILGTTADNQADLHSSLVQNNAAISIGDINQTSGVKLLQTIDQLKSNYAAGKFTRPQETVDGHSEHRIRRVLTSLIQ